ncbi:hypothetical protein SDC9_51516 [bioreactor metagenome]|uniref:Uncharacterized protein n=1 Tax=bioreactor metagenome TaxID=1076179 RepID=A0A644WP22_9ZZZZ
MLSVTSCFSPTLYKKHITRFWPLWALYCIIWLFAMPVNLILNHAGSYSVRYTAEGFANITVLDMLPKFGLWMAVWFGGLAAVAVWSYLYNNKAVWLIHSLPVRREGLFLTGWLAGMSFMALPNAAVFLLTLAAEASAGSVNLRVLGIWLLVQTCFCLFFFSFATLCAFVTGNILAVPAFYVIFNGVFMGIFGLIESVLHNLVFGFAKLYGAWPAVYWLTPVYQFYERVYVNYDKVEGVITNATFFGTATVLIYACVGLVFSAAAFVLYRYRKLELAGEVVTVGWLRPVFKYGVAFCGSLAFGSLLFQMFMSVLPNKAWSMLFFLLLCGAISYFAAEMLLERSFRVFKKSWKGGVVFLIIIAAATAAIEFDVTGYETSIPTAGLVKSITMSDANTPPYDDYTNTDIVVDDSDAVAEVIALHASVVGNKSAVEAGLSALDYMDKRTPAGNISIENGTAQTFRLTYIMQDGKEIERYYTVPVTAEILSDATSPASRLLAFLNRPKIIESGFFPAGTDETNLVEGYLSFPSEKDGWQDVTLTAEQAKVLYEGVKKDLADGCLGERFLLQDKEYLSTVCANEIVLTFYRPGADEKNDTVSLSFHPQSNSKGVIAALQSLGLLDADHNLVTYLEQKQWR